MFQKVDAYAGDPILTLMERFKEDPRSDKVNLSIGLYYNEDGIIPQLQAVAEAEARLNAQPHGASLYLPMEGLNSYRHAIAPLLFGADHPVLQQQRVATIQTLGGSGALKVGADFLKRYFPESGVWVSDPTWENHVAIFAGAGFEVSTYPWYDEATNGVRFNDLLATLKTLPARSIVLLHPCCHNPTGAVTGVNLGILNQKGSLYVTRPSLQGYITTREELTEASNELFSLIASGVIKVDVAEQQKYPLKDAQRAHEILESRATQGSSLLIP